MPLLTFHINELPPPDSRLQVKIEMAECICTARESDMIDAILKWYSTETAIRFKSLSSIDNSTTIRIGKG